MRVSLQNFWKALQRTSQAISDDAVDACYSAAFGSIARIQRTIDDISPYPPVDTGAYRAGWQVVKVPGVGAELSNAVPYAGVVEEGTGPHEPNHRDLKAWAYRKTRQAPKKTGAGAGRKKKGSILDSLFGKRKKKKPSNRAPAPLTPDQQRKREEAKRKREAAAKAAHKERAEELYSRALRKIREHGISGKHVLEQSVPDMERILKMELDRKFRRPR